VSLPGLTRQPIPPPYRQGAHAIAGIPDREEPQLPQHSLKSIFPAMPYYVYILASRKNGTLYTGVTNGLGRRCWQHREGVVSGFTKTYRVKRLVHFEQFASVRDAIQREKNIKHWPRRWKVELIEADNPDWFDLYPRLNM
jgi:putative endonuclease